MGAQLLRFAGFESVMAFVVFGLFEIFFVLGALGLTALLAAGTYGRKPLMFFGLAVLIVGVVFLGRTILDSARQFRTLSIAADGSWSLINPLGFTLLELPSDAPRAINDRSRDTWMFIGTAVRYDQVWVEVELPDGRVFPSTRGTQTSQVGARAELGTWLEGRARERSR